MQHPFQCITTVKPSSERTDSGGYLIAACGPKLISVCLTMGAILSEWTADAKANGNGNGNGDVERPTKKQRIFSTPVKLPNVIKLTVSPDEQHAVAVTEDKCLRIFGIEDRGRIVELSQRFMPKRPCAVQILPDNATIICGDKFGDVYSLPLFPEAMAGEDAASGAQSPERPQDSAQAFKPSATNLTVHTQRNCKSLEAQQKQKNLTPKTKEPLKFEHKLLLGHVSMLTDLVYTTREVHGKQRGYIITADRDEHIRISRGPPQSHVIEGFCLGHKEFVSKVCLVPDTNLLVSGGGDEWIGVWEWPSFKLRRKLNLLEHLPWAEQISVSGVWLVPAEIGDKTEGVVVVACEKVRTLAFVSVSDLLKFESEPVIVTTQSFDYPILDIACDGDRMLVSFDSRGNDEAHKNGEAGGNSEARVRPYHLEARGKIFTRCIKSELDATMDSVLTDLNDLAYEVKNEKALNELLHGIANLRKRGYQDDVEDED